MPCSLFLNLKFAKIRQTLQRKWKIDTVIAEETELVLVGLENLLRAQKSGVPERLAQAGIEAMLLSSNRI